MKYLMMVLMCFAVLGLAACEDDEKDPVVSEETTDAASDASVSDGAQSTEDDTATEDSEDAEDAEDVEVSDETEEESSSEDDSEDEAAE